MCVYPGLRDVKTLNLLSSSSSDVPSLKLASCRKGQVCLIISERDVTNSATWLHGVNCHRQKNRCHIDKRRVKETAAIGNKRLSAELSYLFKVLTKNILYHPTYTSLPAGINHWLLNEMSIKAWGVFPFRAEGQAVNLETEERLSQAILLFHMQPLTVKLELFFSKDRNRLKFPWLDRHQRVC